MVVCKIWYVLYTKRNKEVKVVEDLIENGFEAYTPVKKEKRKWSDRIVKKNICLLPSMVLVFIEKKKINKVFEINFVKKYMFFNGERAKVKNDEVLALKNYIKNETTEFIKWYVWLHEKLPELRTRWKTKLN